MTSLKNKNTKTSKNLPNTNTKAIKLVELLFINPLEQYEMVF